MQVQQSPKRGDDDAPAEAIPGQYEEILPWSPDLFHVPQQTALPLLQDE
jgi:hypothetical protein